MFSFEEVSTFFPSRTCSRAFFAAVMAALSLQWFDPTGTGKLTLFQVTDAGKLNYFEYFPFALLGVLGGLFGAFFVHVNTNFSAIRMGDMWKKRIPIVTEVALISSFTAITNLVNDFMEPLPSTVIHRLFAPCSDLIEKYDELKLCDVDRTPAFGFNLVMSMFIAGMVRFVQMVVTFGTGVPAGLFVPSLFFGACMGRVLGTMMYWSNETWGWAAFQIEPGVYSMIGAAAMLAGVCRVTISLVVIMFELTGALEHIVPFMLAVQIARWTGDYFGAGIYDNHIKLRKYPFLHEPDECNISGKAENLMDDDIDCICVEDMNTIGKSTKWSSF